MAHIRVSHGTSMNSLYYMLSGVAVIRRLSEKYE